MTAVPPTSPAPLKKPHSDRFVRAVAVFEAAKGLFALAAATGLLSLVHHDVHRLALMLIEHSHLNPAAKYPRILLEASSHVGDTKLLLLAAGAVLYSAFRLTEAYGLYYEKTWAELLAAFSGALYLPFELAGLYHKPGWHGVLLVVANLAIVAYMAWTVRGRLVSRTGPPAA